MSQVNTASSIKITHRDHANNRETRNVKTKIFLEAKSSMKLRKNFLKGEEGYKNEVFNLCRKYLRMDPWHGKCPAKVNPMSRSF